MAFEFKLPDIGEGVHEGEIAKWLIAPGQTIQEDAPMVEIMTDKVTVEITAPVSGTVQAQHYKEGDTVKVGSIIIEIDTDNATGQAKPNVENKPVETPPSATQNVPEPAKQKTAEPLQQAFAQHSETKVTAPSFSASNGLAATSSQKVLAAPAVRKLARTMGVELAQIVGTGPKGRIQKMDLSHVASVPSRSKVSKAKQPETRLPFIGMRRKIGEHLVHAKQTAPHFTYVEEGDMTALVAMRDDLLPMAAEQGIKLSYLPFIIKAVIAGLKQYPKLNSTLDETTQEIVLKPHYHMGIAVATEDGLIVPVLKDADEKSIFELAQEITRLSQGARNKKLTLADMQGGTFTLTSIGSIGGIFSAPIINYPEVAIMGINKIEKRPVVRNDKIAIREMTYLSISCDHRVVDGMEAALFMKAVIENLEHPARLLIND